MRTVKFVWLCVVLCGLPNTYAQTPDYVYKGIVLDSATRLPLPDVRIYSCDNSPVRSDRNGRFQLKGNANTHFHFRKAGYVRHTEAMTGEKGQTVCLLKSDPSMQEKLSKKYLKDKTDVIYDDMPVPHEEWGDAFSTDPSEIESINVLSADKTNARNRLVIRSIFGCTEKDMDDEKSAF